MLVSIPRFVRKDKLKSALSTQEKRDFKSVTFKFCYAGSGKSVLVLCLSMFYVLYSSCKIQNWDFSVVVTC